MRTKHRKDSSTLAKRLRESSSLTEARPGGNDPLPQKVLKYLAAGDNVSDAVRKTGIHRNTIHNWIRKDTVTTSAEGAQKLHNSSPLADAGPLASIY